tara:strand:+ start:138 stop:530 length:393 start_codon:yes stop_codon:yes gene_type:complete
MGVEYFAAIDVANPETGENDTFSLGCLTSYWARHTMFGPFVTDWKSHRLVMTQTILDKMKLELDLLQSETNDLHQKMRDAEKAAHHIEDYEYEYRIYSEHFDFVMLISRVYKAFETALKNPKCIPYINYG